MAVNAEFGWYRGSFSSHVVALAMIGIFSFYEQRSPASCSVFEESVTGNAPAKEVIKDGK